ncbi:hypothetical protein [Serratia sp. D1N4]
MINTIRLNKNNDDRIRVTLLVDDVEVANKIYLKAIESETDVHVDDNVLKAFKEKNRDNTQDKQNKLDSFIKNKMNKRKKK